MGKIVWEIEGRFVAGGKNDWKGVGIGEMVWYTVWARGYVLSCVGIDGMVLSILLILLEKILMKIVKDRVGKIVNYSNIWWLLGQKFYFLNEFQTIC